MAVPYNYLQHYLDEDSLEEVLENLNYRSLTQLSGLDTYFENIIGERIVKRRIINLKRNIDTEETEYFKAFGQWVRKLKIDTNLPHLLDTIVRCSLPATLTEMDLVIRHCDETISDLELNESMPFFSELRKLTLRDVSFYNESAKEFFKKISETATNISTLQVLWVDYKDNFEWLNNMKNLHELEISSGIHHFPKIPLTNCFRANPNLKVLKFTGARHMRTIIKSLTEHCPRLETFCYVHLLDDTNRYFRHGYTSHYDFLSKFPNLNNVTLTSYSRCGCDLYYPLTTLARSNIVKLKVCMDFKRELNRFLVVNNKTEAKAMQTSFTDFCRLEKFELLVKFNDCAYDFNFWLQFIFHFMSQLKNHRNVSFVFGTVKMKNVDKILEFAPNIRTLVISRMTTFHLPVQIRKIVRAFSTHRLKYGQRLPHLIVNQEQWNELQVYKDIENIMRITVDHVNPFIKHPFTTFTSYVGRD